MHWRPPSNGDRAIFDFLRALVKELSIRKDKGPPPREAKAVQKLADV